MSPTKKLRDPFSSISHLAGAVLFLPFTVLLVRKAAAAGNTSSTAAAAVFGLCLLLMYCASGIYHAVQNEKAVAFLRKMDHALIYILIAGTYTPICLIPLQGPQSRFLLLFIWLLAAAGVLLTFFWIEAPRALTTALYLAMGWLILSALPSLVKAASLLTVSLLVGGGLLYSLGAVIYALKWPPLAIKGFGFHELFHLFVLGGSALHIGFIFRLL